MAMSRGSTGDIILQGGQKLDLRDRSLSTQDVIALADLLSTRTSEVSTLILYNVRLNSDDAVSLARALEFNDTLATLNFTHNPIGEVGTAALAEMIKFNTTIREVSLANTVLNSQACALLADALIMNRTLESLNLEKNRIAAQGAQFLATALGDNETLRSLWLDGNQIGDAGAQSIAAALAVEGGSRLERLSLANTGITDTGAAALGDALVGNVWLKRLVMAKLELAPQVLQGRGEGGEGAAATSKGLQTIDLSGQALSATLDYPIVCRLIAGNPRLARLRLSRAGLCGVTSGGRGRRSLVGLHSLALTLKAAPPRLVVLDIGLNFVDDEAMEVVSRGLEKNRVLTTLVLQGNGISEKGMTFLAASLPSSIVDLDLSNNPAVGERGGKALARFLLDFVRSANLRRLDVSMCNLRDDGLASLAEGVEAAKGLEWLNIARNLNDPGSVVGPGAGSGAGKTAIGLALLSSGEESRLQGLTTDLWAVSKGQKDLQLIRPVGTVPCQLPSSADVCLLSGVLCLNEWLRRVALDGNPIDEAGLGFLCRALLKNGSIQSVSLNRCGLGERSGMLLLHTLEEKPGLEVDASDGNPFGEEVENKLEAALRRARRILSAKTECRRPMVHLLGEAGAGKSTLKDTLGRGYFSSFFNTSDENAPDRGAEDPSQRTLGVTTSELSLGAGSPPILVQDYGGMQRFRGIAALDGGLACPTSVYVVVVSLTQDRSESKRQIKYWLRLIQTVGPSQGSVIVLVGSRADELGSVGQDYLQKLWDRAREDLTREELRAGLDASLPTFAGCLAMDCRKAGNANVVRLRDVIAHAAKLFSNEGEGWVALSLYPAVARRVERWVGEGASVVRWSKFVSAVQRQLCPRASEAACADLACSLAREGRLVLKGMSRGREVERGKGWVVLHPDFFLHDIMGGVFRSTISAVGAEGRGAGGVVSAAVVCEAVIGGLGAVRPETVVQALIEGDVCAELPPEDEKNQERTSWELGASSRSLEGGASTTTTADNTNGSAGAGGYHPVDETAFPSSSSTLLWDGNNDPAFPTAKPAVAAAAPPPAPPPPAFGGYDGGGGGGGGGGARRSSEKAERKRVISAAALPSASSGAASRQHSPRATPTTTAAVRKGSLTLDVGRRASGSSAASASASASASPLASSSSSKGTAVPSGAQQHSELAAGAGAGVMASGARRSSERWRALGILKESWTKLERTRLLFPALLPPAEGAPRRGLQLLGGGRRSSVDYDDGVCLCGRRASCRSPVLLPGLFHMLQARLANRYRGRVILRDRYAEVSLDGWDAASGGIIVPTTRDGDEDGDGGRGGRKGGDGEAEAAAIVGKMELVEDDLPGGDAIDVTVSSKDRKAALLAVLGLRLVVEQVLSQAPSVVVEDMAIAAASIRDGRSPNERLTLPLSEVHQNRADGLKECFFGDNTLPEPLSDLLWEGPEEHEVDEAGRIVSAYGRIPPAAALELPGAAATATASPGLAAAGGRKTPLAAAATVVANPFAGFSRRKRGSTPAVSGDGTPPAGGGSGAAAATTAKTPMNPFAPAAPVAASAAAPGVATGKRPAASPGLSPSPLNPFASPPPPKATATEAATEPDKTHGGSGGSGSRGNVAQVTTVTAGSGVASISDGNVGGFADLSDAERESASASAASLMSLHAGDNHNGSPTHPLASPDGADGAPEVVGAVSVAGSGGLSRDGSSGGQRGAEAAGGGGVNGGGSGGSGGSRSSSPLSFSFDGEVFRDAGRLFGPHLRGQSYNFGRQRVELVLRRPGGLRLGIWRPPVEEREEREREKEKGKAASEPVTAMQQQQLSSSRVDDNSSSTGGGDNQDFNVFLPADDLVGDAADTSSNVNTNTNKGSSGGAREATRGETDSVGGGAAQETTPGLKGATSSSSSSSPLSASPRSVASPVYSPSTGRPTKSGDVGSPTSVRGASRAVGGGVPTELLKERPAVVEEVTDEGVMSCFNCLGSSAVFGVVGCVVAAVSTEPFQDTDTSPKLLTFEEARAALASTEYPLFVQLCRPPLVFITEPAYPVVKLLCTLVLTNRSVEKVDGEFRLGHEIAEEGASRWLLATTAVPASVGDLGNKVEVNLGDYHCVGLYLLTSDEAMSLLKGHPSRDVFLFVHGFNTSFNFGVRGSAVKGRALKKSLTVCLTWPSNPPGEGAGWLIKRVMSTYERRYTYCEHNMHASIFLFLQVALDIQAAANAAGKKMCWKSHSMGCYLLLNVVDRLRWKGEDMQSLFGAVILDAPDVPTWFFRSMIKVLADNGVSVCHYFNPLDNAIQASCSRRALHRPVPGQDAILAHPLVQGVLCDKSHSSTGMNHDYGRADGRCLLDQRDFLAGEPPDQRVLEEIVSAEGVPCWQLKTW
eukprot:g8764.t2